MAPYALVLVEDLGPPLQQVIGRRPGSVTGGDRQAELRGARPVVVDMHNRQAGAIEE